MLPKFKFGSNDPVIMERAATKLQSMFRRRGAMKNLRNLIRRMYVIKF